MHFLRILCGEREWNNLFDKPMAERLWSTSEEMAQGYLIDWGGLILNMLKVLQLPTQWWRKFSLFGLSLFFIYSH